MKLGTETGSLVNSIVGSSEFIFPNVGDGATILLWSDRCAGTVIEVSSKRIVVQEDTAIRIDKNGVGDFQEYRYERNPEGITHVFTETKKGWKSHGISVRFGVRNHYYDYSF